MKNNCFINEYRDYVIKKKVNYLYLNKIICMDRFSSIYSKKEKKKIN